jgi:hypothetical protein
MRISTTFTVLAVGALAVVGLAGCASGDDTSSAPTVTDTVTTAPQPSTSETTSPSASTSVTAQPTSSSGGTGTTVARCAASSLAGSIQAGSGGAAGSVYVTLALKNTGAAACTLQGWPGVSLVGGGNGTQIGKSADFDRSTTHATVTLAPGTTSTASFKYVQAGNFPAAECVPTKGDGFRVYPPGSKQSLFIKNTSIAGCKKATESVFTVGALQAP